MDPVSAITAGLSVTKTGFDLIKGLRELLKRPDLDRGEILARLTELQDLMLEAKLALMNADEAKTRLEARIIDLSRMADFAADFKLIFGVYWHETYPYCPVCWDVDRKPVRLSGPIRIAGGGPVEQWTCPLHKQPISLSWYAQAEVRKQDAPA
jgi:hypothetical protein